MPRSFFALAAVMLGTTPVMAQSGVTHLDATGAIAGRSPHKILRPIAAPTRCGNTLHLPAGKLPTYGVATSARCRPTVVAGDAWAKTSVD